MSIFPDPLYYQEGQLRGVEQRSGKVNLIFYKLNLFPIFLVDKVKKKNRKIVICRIIKIFFTIKRCEESKRTLKNPFASRFAVFNTTLKRLRITDQWYNVLVKFRFGRNRDFLVVLKLSLAGGPKDGKRFDADWRPISSASFHTSSDNCERNMQKWNSNNKDCKKETIATLMWLMRSSGIKLRETECFPTTR